MLNERYIRLLTKRYSTSHPYWFPPAWENQARQLASRLHPSLTDLVCRWLDTGVETDATFGDYSILALADLRNGDYLSAIELMNTYLLDPEKGRTLILQF